MSELRVKEQHYAKEFSVTEALEQLISVDPYSGGELEQIRYKLDNLTKLVLAWMAMQVTTVEQLNALAEYGRFIDVNSPDHG